MATMMVLGGYTFALNPEKCDMPVASKRAANVETLGGAAYFSWGTFLPGTEIVLEWTYMPVAMFSELETLNEANAQIVFNPGSGTTYNVEIKNLTGKWFLDQTLSAQFRGDVKLELVIMSEV
jgi:hypothetical protein